MADKVAYEPHPVTPERKAELRAQGFKIVDARFKPKEAAPSVPQSLEDIEDLRKGEVREWLEAHGVSDIPPKVADMKDMLKRVMFFDA